MLATGKPEATFDAEGASGPTGMEKLLQPNRADAEAAIALLISYLGDDPQREGLLETPSRVISALEQMLSGYRTSSRQHRPLTYSVGSGGIIGIRNIVFSSYCEHHMMPFFGTVHIAYRPTGKSVAAPDLQSLVQLCAARLQTQERLTAEISDRLSDIVEPDGLGVQVQSVHTCMSLRGVRKPDASTITTVFRGTFLTDMNERNSFVSPL